MSRPNIDKNVRQNSRFPASHTDHELAQLLLSNPDGKLNIKHHTHINEHRSGWSYCIAAISALHNEDGILFDDFIEKRFSWDLPDNIDRGVIPYNEPWIGILHNPPNMPVWFEYQNSPQLVLQRSIMQESLEHCKGLYVLSEYHKNWLREQVEIPVGSLLHPTETPKRKFSLALYRKNRRRKLIQTGYWLRRMHSLPLLELEGFTKVWLVTSDFAKECFEREARTMDVYTDRGETHVGRYEEWSWVDNNTYDELLEKNLVFLHLYDASANNAVVECIQRNTPLLVNPLPAVKEYLGEDYPFYFESLEEAARKAQDDTLVAETHTYLKARDKRPFSAEYFRQSIESSSIYKSLSRPAPDRKNRQFTAACFVAQREVSQLKILLRSLNKFVSKKQLNLILLICADAEYDALRFEVSLLEHKHNVSIKKMSQLFDNRSWIAYQDMPVWKRVLVRELAVSRWVTTDAYLMLDPDIFLCAPLEIDSEPLNGDTSNTKFLSVEENDITWTVSDQPAMPISRYRHSNYRHPLLFNANRVSRLLEDIEKIHGKSWLSVLDEIGTAEQLEDKVFSGSICRSLGGSVGMINTAHMTNGTSLGTLFHSNKDEHTFGMLPAQEEIPPHQIWSQLEKYLN